MIAMIRKFLDLAGERKKQLYLAWLFQALTSICEGAIYFMLFLAIKDILGGSFTREKLMQYTLQTEKRRHRKMHLQKAKACKTSEYNLYGVAVFTTYFIARRALFEELTIRNAGYRMK